MKSCWQPGGFVNTSVIESIRELLLGFLQGMTEILPISSSAHTTIWQDIWGSFTHQAPVSFSVSVFLHLGTVLTICLLYRVDLAAIGRSMLHFRPRQTSGAALTPYQLPLAGQNTVPHLLACLTMTAVVGLALRGAAEAAFAEPKKAAGLLIINGLFLLATATFVKRHEGRPHRAISDLSMRHFLLLGAVQGLAVFPGISRLGITLMLGLIFGLSWYQSIRLSFLLLVPTVLAASVFEIGLAYMQSGTQVSLHMIPLAFVGLLVAAVGSWVAIRIIRREGLHAERALYAFGLYCVAAGPFYLLYLSYFTR